MDWSWIPGTASQLMITAIISWYLAARKVKCIVNKYLPMTLAVSVQHLVLDSCRQHGGCGGGVQEGGKCGHFYWPSLKFSSDNCGCFPPPAPAPYYWDSIKSLRRWDCHCPWVAWSGARGQFKQCTELYSKHALFQLRIYKGILPEHTKCYYRILQFSCAWSRPSVTMVAGCKMLWGWSQQLVSPHQHSTSHPGPDHHHFVITFLRLLRWAL